MKGERDAALYQSDGKWDDALKKYEILLSIYEKINDATGQRNTLTQIAKIHHAKNDPEAESKTRAKLASVPRPAGDALSKAAAENRLEPAINEIRESKKNEPTKYIFSQDEINNVGYDLLRHRRFSEAIEVFKFNVELYPDDANPYDSLAEAYMKAGNTGQARNYYLKALELATKAGTDYVAASANTGLGELSMKAGNNEEARRHYLRGLELGTKAHNDYVQASANYGLGELSRKAGDNNEAIRYYKTALALATKAGNDDVNKNATAALKKLGAMP
jgi:tetratricopeptide (TPR) repeat protein